VSAQFMRNPDELNCNIPEHRFTSSV
jgi:hypothetical protein